MNRASHTSKIYGLDVLRAAAIIFVMFSHAVVYSEHIISIRYYKWFMLDGVNLFFVLSGFLIGGILINKIETSDFNLKQLMSFWIRRWLRTLPAYFFVLSLLVAAYYSHHRHLPPQWFHYYTFTQNFNSPHPLFFAEAWSLSVEEWFYILLPASLFLLLKLRPKKRWLILACVLFGIVFITLLRLYKVEQPGFSITNFGNEIMKVVVTRMDAMMYGVLAAWLSIYYSSKFYANKRALFLFGSVLLIGSNLVYSDFFLSKIQLSLTPIAAVCLLPALSQLKVGHGSVYKCVTFISSISYAMYLCNHMIVLRGIMPMLVKWLRLDLDGIVLHNLFAYVLFWLFTIGSAYLLHLFIEKPFMDLRKKVLMNKDDKPAAQDV